MAPRGPFSKRQCSASSARVSQDCLCTVTTLPFPALSPDLSPIGHIWNHFGIVRWASYEFERTRGKVNDMISGEDVLSQALKTKGCHVEENLTQFNSGKPKKDLQARNS
ncbi:hypothetical protein TNCV_2046311 [Trichonephila clavipes]|uniref:Uncharacterized protein n=1 Tax=Trichonephila clavipes TaxID=2585209 RepID=A0A8X6SVM5_TRICX|nr:hypothetical protein TNCV_2046311 [Trichonephila clavipes]